MVLAARLELEDKPRPLNSRELLDFAAGNQQTVVLEALFVAIPPQHANERGWRWSETRAPHVDAILEPLPVPPRGLHLEAEELVADRVPYEHLHCLQVGKGTERVQRIGLGQAADDLHLADEPKATSIHLRSSEVLVL